MLARDDSPEIVVNELNPMSPPEIPLSTEEIPPAISAACQLCDACFADLAWVATLNDQISTLNPLPNEAPEWAPVSGASLAALGLVLSGYWGIPPAESEKALGKSSKKIPTQSV